MYFNYLQKKVLLLLILYDKTRHETRMQSYVYINTLKKKPENEIWNMNGHTYMARSS